MKRLKGIARLIFDAVEETTKLVEETHESVVKKHVDVLAAAPELEAPVRAVDDVRRALTHGVYQSILLVNRGVGSLAEAGFALAEPLWSRSPTNARRRCAPTPWDLRAGGSKRPKAFSTGRSATISKSATTRSASI